MLTVISIIVVEMIVLIAEPEFMPWMLQVCFTYPNFQLKSYRLMAMWNAKLILEGFQ